ncbi:hypothetical protein PUN28_017278 [Cardiocondyla obscurior]|uniref:Uncharacterized protein n=1 Tax=Cardiocondyla obscurior TaxID=286306 RepID=A0AAW2EQC4_9HYME
MIRDGSLTDFLGRERGGERVRTPSPSSPTKMLRRRLRVSSPPPLTCAVPTITRSLLALRGLNYFAGFRPRSSLLAETPTPC